MPDATSEQDERHVFCWFCDPPITSDPAFQPLIRGTTACLCNGQLIEHVEWCVTGSNGIVCSFDYSNRFAMFKKDENGKFKRRFSRGCVEVAKYSGCDDPLTNRPITADWRGRVTK